MGVADRESAWCASSRRVNLPDPDVPTRIRPRKELTMELPFTHEAFLDVFGAYNAAWWPAAVALWVASTWAGWVWIREGRVEGRAVFSLLAIHWAWSGIVYHWLYFRSINPAAAIFAVGFVGQAALFAWLVAASRGRVIGGLTLRAVLGGALLGYALMYPILGLAFGLRYPRLPLFAVPCPTTLLTAGWLLAATGVPRVVNIVPLAWAALGSSAAFALGIHADLALVAAGVLLAIDTVAPTVLGARAAT
jgi:hypothetical protein